MDNKKGWTLVLGFLMLVAIAASAMVYLIYSSVQRTVEPVQDMTGNLGTRVAQILNPTPTILPSPLTIIRDVRSLARLETIQYTVEKVITAESGQGVFSSLFGDKLVFVAHGRVIAGIDLAKLGPDDVTMGNGLLTLRLPAPEIFISSLDNDKSYVYDRTTGLLTKGDINLESAARRAAEDEIQQAAVEDGILDLAKQNGESYLTRLLKDLGYPDVAFTYKPSTATPTPSATATH
jgi:hypothetical protein